MEKSEIINLPYSPSTLENIDFAVFEWVDKTFNLFAETNEGFNKVPVIWNSQERAYQIKNHPDLRDVSGTVKFPVISIQRGAIDKNPINKGMFFGNQPKLPGIKGGAIMIDYKINQDKTKNFANSTSVRTRNQATFKLVPENKKIVYQILTIPYPVHVLIDYQIKINTDYQSQMNQLVQPFLTKIGSTNYSVISYNRHRYEVFVDENFENNNNLEDLEDQPRMFETIITLKVLGYVNGEDANEKQNKIAIRENPVEFIFKRERILERTSSSFE